MSDEVVSECSPCADADEVVPFDWVCANCGAIEASKRRGPNKEFCSKGPCRRLAGLASAAVKDDSKSNRIATLEAKVRDQATTITLLQNKVARVQAMLERADAAASSKAAAAPIAKQPVVPQSAKTAAALALQRPTNHPALTAMIQGSRPAAPPKATLAAAAHPTVASGDGAVGARRPLAALSVNSSHGPQPAKKAKPSEPVLPEGWQKKKRSSQPGCFRYINKHFKLNLGEPPREHIKKHGLTFTLLKQVQP